MLEAEEDWGFVLLVSCGGGLGRGVAFGSDRRGWSLGWVGRECMSGGDVPMW